MGMDLLNCSDFCSFLDETAYGGEGLVCVRWCLQRKTPLKKTCRRQMRMCWIFPEDVKIFKFLGLKIHLENWIGDFFREKCKVSSQPLQCTSKGRESPFVTLQLNSASDRTDSNPAPQELGPLHKTAEELQWQSCEPWEMLKPNSLHVRLIWVLTERSEGIKRALWSRVGLFPIVPGTDVDNSSLNFQLELRNQFRLG